MIPSVPKTDKADFEDMYDEMYDEMHEEMHEEMHIDEIRKEYTRIDGNWLWLHYKTSIVLVVFAFITECVMGIYLVNSDLLTTTVERFFWKFLVVPSGINILLVIIATVVMKSRSFSQKIKIYSVSFIFVGISFILFTAHGTFSATYYIFAIAIMVTTIYADYYVTSVTALTSILAIVFSELFIVWDRDKISIFQSTHRYSDFLISLFVLTAFSIACMVVIRFEQEKNAASIQMEMERQQLQKSLHMDEITGIYNRKALHTALKDVDDSASNGKYILAIVDIDKFKEINDNWGHHIGDLCLIEFAKILKEESVVFTPFRYGGDEFCILFRNRNMEEAEAICRQIMVRLNALAFTEYPMLKLTASFGLAASSGQMDAVRLFINADHALYEAKKVRNAIYIY